MNSCSPGEMSYIKSICSAINQPFLNLMKPSEHLVTQIRYKYADWKMIRDVKRRKCVAQYSNERVRINSLRKNDILPLELREIADAEINALPRDSAMNRVRDRCAVTSRPRGVVFRWRLSRIVWRHLADYNKLSGVQRAMW